MAEPHVLVQQAGPGGCERKGFLPVTANQLPVEGLHRRTGRQAQHGRGNGTEKGLDDAGRSGGHLIGVRGDDNLHVPRRPQQPNYSTRELRPGRRGALPADALMQDRKNRPLPAFMDENLPEALAPGTRWSSRR